MKTLLRQRSRVAVILALPLLLCIVPLYLASAAEGDLDPTFGPGGTVFLNFGVTPGETDALGVAVQQDGRIVVSGRAFGNSNSSALARLNSDGSLDSTFGTGGVVRPAVTHGSVELQSDGKILVLGSVLVRYNTDGTVDTSFGSAGQVTTNFFKRDLTIQPDQKIIVVGQSGTFTGVNGGGFVVARFNQNGTPDGTFGVGGQVTTIINNNGNSAEAAAVQNDGKIVVVGQTSGLSPSEFAVVRYNSDGSIDTSFGSNGIVITDVGSLEHAQSVVIQTDGKIVIGGDANITVLTDFVLVRYNPDGSLDNSFGTGGKVTTNFGQNRMHTLARLLLLPNGKIIAVGGLDRFPDTNTGPAAWALARYNTDGSLDNSFGVGGKVETVTSSFGAIAKNAALQQDGTIIAVGQFPNGGNHSAVVARYLNTGTILPAIQFQSNQYSIVEGSAGARVITLTRTGNINAASSVQYETSDASGLNNCDVNSGSASARCDYTAVAGTVSFIAGQASATFDVPIINDVYTEGSETLTLTLRSPVGAILGTPSSATLTIQDNDAVGGAANPIDTPAFFVRQHYLDVLNREPEPSGLNGWLNILNNCPQGDTSCDEIEVSSGFFRSPEFFDRAYYIYRFYEVGLGRKPDYAEFQRDLRVVAGFLTEAELEARKQQFALDFSQRADFRARYDQFDSQTRSQEYVDALSQTAGVTLANRQQLSFELANSIKQRWDVLRAIVQSPEVSSKFFNKAFVVIGYFAFLRRDPDAQYLVWLSQLDNPPAGQSPRDVYRNMINGFIASQEYRRRFGPN
ncbi:MAG TPA: Calx-beta domain-containing protein [Pyrinomonadaceae bacterium]|nr:Calx-beta domain-containing protein [Pyrinomonadaceae bacterium]